MDDLTTQNVINQLPEILLAGAKKALESRALPDFIDSIEIKEDGSKVTLGDRESQAILQERLGRLFPEDVEFTGEEDKDHPKTHVAKRRWVVDPIDGTGNFIRGKEPDKYADPQSRRWAVSIALKERQPDNSEKVVIGAIFCPHPDATAEQMDGTMYLATEHDTTQIIPVISGVLQPATAKRSEIPDNKVALGGFATEAIKQKLIETVKSHKHTISGMGSFCASAMHVLEGRKSGCVNGVNCEWDSAAAGFLLKQAGIKVSEYASGDDRFTMIAANDLALFSELNKTYLEAINSPGAGVYSPGIANNRLNGHWRV